MDLTQFDWSTYRKIPVTIDAIKLTAPRVIETLEGPVTANIGDMLICGTESEYYPCNLQTFAETYERLKAHVAVDRETPQETLQALNPQGGMPQKTHLGWQRYQSRTLHVKAAPVKERIEIETQRGTLIGDAGDMLIKRSDTDVYPCKPEIFSKTYERDIGMDCFEAFNPDVHLINTLKDIQLPTQGVKSFAVLDSGGFAFPALCLWCVAFDDTLIVHREWRACEKATTEIKQAVLKYNATEPKAQTFWCRYIDLPRLRTAGLDVKCVTDIVDSREGHSKENRFVTETLLWRILDALKAEQLLICKDAYIAEEGLPSLSKELQTYSYLLRSSTQLLGLALEIRHPQEISPENRMVYDG